MKHIQMTNDLSKVSDAFIKAGFKDIHWSDKACFAIGRAMHALLYGADMATSSLTCLEDAQHWINESIVELKKEHNIK